MKLFEAGKIGMYCDSILHSLETRQETEVKVVTLVLRVQPFTAQHARLMHEQIHATLFRLSDGEPKDGLKRVAFSLGIPRQNLQVFAAPDVADPSIALTQVQVAHIYARTEKSVRGFGLVCKLSFGPLGRDELAYIQDWHLSQRFVSFEVAEPGMFDDVEAEDDGEDAPSGVPSPMFDDAGQETPAINAANRPLHSHQSRRGRKTGPVAALVGG